MYRKDEQDLTRDQGLSKEIFEGGKENQLFDTPTKALIGYPPRENWKTVMFNPGLFTILQRMREQPKPTPTLDVPLDDPMHAQWQALCRGGQVVEAIKEARGLGLDLPQAYALINEFRQQEGLMPPKPKRWWWPFG